MKKIYLFLFMIFSFVSIKSVNAISGTPSWWDSSTAPMDAYLSNNSTIYSIMSDSNTTCKNYLEEIGFNLYGELGRTYDKYILDLHYNSHYDSQNNTFEFRLITGFHTARLERSNNNIRVFIQTPNTPKLYKVDCANKKVTFEKDMDQVGSYMYISIIEARDVGNEFFPSLYQSSFGSIYFASDNTSSTNNMSYALRGVYDNSLKEVMSVDDFVGSDYYSNNLILGAGVPLVPFYAVMSNDFSQIDIPYIGGYNYIYMTANTTLYFTPKQDLDVDVDKKLYIRPVILDKKISGEALYNLMGKADYKLGVYGNYKELSQHTDYSFYWNNSYNDFFVLDSNYLTSSSSMYALIFDSKRFAEVSNGNQSIVYFNPSFWNVSSYNLVSNQTDISISGVNGSINYGASKLQNNYSEIDGTSNIQNKPQYGNTDGSNIQGSTGTSFFDGLLGNIKGVGEFIGSVSSGISTLTDSISSLITMAFSTLNSLPVQVTSVLYLCFLLTMVSIILKIFL